MLLFIVGISWLCQPAVAAEISEVIWKHPGYDITVYRTGRVRIDFVLNQMENPREQIEGHFSGYPPDRFWERNISQVALKEFFLLVDFSDWTGVKESYRAPVGTFEYYGHEGLTRLQLKSGDTIIKEIWLGDSRIQNWPPFVRRLIKEVVSIATEDGSQLPLGPFLD